MFVLDRIEPERSAFAPLTIGAVERDTGLSKDTLRVWERRYGFPTPERDSAGERAYSLAQVEKLRLIKRLLDQGMRPGKLMAASSEELGSMITARRATPGAAVPPALADMADLVRLHRNEELRAALSQLLLKLGLQRFVIECVAALNVAIGEAWMRGAIGVHEEHLYTEQIQNLLRAAISAQHAAGRRPKVLLTTFPGEEHALGLLMVEAILVAEGAACVSLGTQTPLTDIRHAAIDGRADVVALSFSAAYSPRHAIEGLTSLREALPAQIALWAGGEGVRNKGRSLRGVHIADGLDDVIVALHEWRAAHKA